MKKVPDIIILVGQNKEMNAVRESIKLGLCLVSVLDTNCDPTLTDFLVPANDDSLSSVSIILKCFTQALKS